MNWYQPDDVVIPDLYATPADYTAWTGAEAPTNVLPILRACSGIVYDATSSDIYDTDPDTGLPTSARILGALRDATCIQAAAWVTLKIDPTSGGVQQANAGSATTKKLGSGVIVRSDSEAAAVAAATAAAQVALIPEAVKLLHRNGLGTAQIIAFG